jgi:DNA-directed RNA polymerase III subunit RPC3
LIQTVEEALSLEKKVINTATLSDPERFSEIPYSMEDCTEDPPKPVSGAKV